MKIAVDDLSRVNVLEWAKRNRLIYDGSKMVPFSITRSPRAYPFLKDIYYARGYGGASHIVIMKPRQVGATEFAINSAFYAIDVWGLNTIYTLPGQKELRAFAGARVNSIISTSPRIQQMFSSIDNLELKVGRKASLYFRGTNSAAGLEEVPAGYVIRDEIDQMNQQNAAMVLQALGGSFYKWILDLSHPTVPEYGIHLQYLSSTQHAWHFKCPHCGEVQTVEWANNVDVENKRFICRSCGKEVTKQDMWNGFYVAKHPNRPIVGFHFNQLISPTVSLSDQIELWKQSQGRPYLLKIFYNTVLALPYAESAKKWTEEDIRRLMTGPPMAMYGNDTVIGLDVGRGLHIWVQQDNSLIAVDVLDKWEDVLDYVHRYNAKAFVVDAGPEYHKAREVCMILRKKGVRAWVCVRSDGHRGERVVDNEKMEIRVNKTEQFDEFYANLSKMVLPSNLPQEAIDCLTAPVRTTKTIAGGNKVGIWVKGISHYADAGSYAMEAQKQLEYPDLLAYNIDIPVMSNKSRWRRR